MSITPEKIKSVLSSFLAKSNRVSDPAKSKTEANNSKKSSGNESAQRKSSATVEAASPKSVTVTLRSHESFLKRVDTFSASTWFGKPAELSPLVCARYGWENVDVDMLQCASCKAFLCGELPMKTDPEAYKKSLEELKHNIVAAHDRFCMLSTFPCPEEFCHVQVDDVVSLSTSFIKRVTALSEIQDQLPKLDTVSLENLGFDAGQAAAYCKRNLVQDKYISPTAVTLAFTGWTCNTAANKEVLVCTLCGRKIGLWNFTSDSGATCGLDESSSDEAEDDGDAELKAKRRKFASSPKKEALNPLEEHSHWCPWIQHVQASASKSSSSASSLPLSPLSASSTLTKIPVCIAALKSIAPGLMDNNTGLAAGMKKSPMTEGLRRFRRALETWSSPKTSLENSQQTQQCSPINVLQ